MWRKGTISVWQLGMMCRGNAPKVAEPGLRKIVEGETHAKLRPMDVTPPGRYPSYEEAFRLVELVGIQNVYAAYFLGKVDRISVSKEAAAKAAKAKGAKP